MQTEHIIAKCTWRSDFDLESKAVELQDFVSRWSHSVLQDELEKYFNHICPTTQTWRIDSLCLDLGDLQLDDLPSELPKRLRSSLQDAFADLFAQQRLSINHSADSNFQILDQNACWNEFTRWYLLYGTTPWWFQGSESAQSVLSQQLHREAHTTTQIIRELGHSEAVRKRIVWQLSGDTVITIVKRLEPWQGNFICQYADNVIAIQAKEKIATTNTGEFRRELWYVILTHLLVDRGTLFNTAAFISSTLRQLAQHYSIEFHSLLEQLHDASVQLKVLGVVNSTFVSAITLIYQQENIQAETTIRQPEHPDYWLTLREMLHQRRQKTSIDKQDVRVEELFSALAQQSPSKMASLLKQEGRFKKVRLGILHHFPEKQLKLLVQVVNPQDQQFILAHVDNTQTLFQQQDRDKKIIWRVLLDYLLSDKGSYFNRRQFVYETLTEISHQQQLDYRVLLDMLMNVVVKQPKHCRFELLSIFQDLKQDLRKREPSVNTEHGYTPLDLYKSSIVEYLRSGLGHSMSQNLGDITREKKYSIARLDEIFSELMRQGHGSSSSAQRKSLTQLAQESTVAHRQFCALLSSPDLNRVSDAEIGYRLLKLIRPTDLTILLSLIQPEASTFCLAFIRQLQQWHKQSRLPCLAGLDLGFQLPALVIQALLTAGKIRESQVSSFRIGEFWISLSKILHRQLGLNLTELNRQIYACFKQAHNNNALRYHHSGAAKNKQSISSAHIYGEINAAALGAMLPFLRGYLTQAEKDEDEHFTRSDFSTEFTPEFTYLSDTDLSPETEAELYIIPLTISPVQNANGITGKTKTSPAQDRRIGQYTSALLFEILSHKLLIARKHKNHLPKEIPAELQALNIEDICQLIERKLASASTQSLKQWSKSHPQRSILLQSLADHQHIKTVALWLNAQLPRQLNSHGRNAGKHILQQSYTLFLQSGLWQGATAVLQEQLELSLWEVSFDNTSMSPEVFLARLVTLACYRLNIRLNDCIENFKQYTPLLKNRHWQKVCGVLSKPLTTAVKKTSDLDDCPEKSLLEGDRNVTELEFTEIVLEELAPISLAPIELHPHSSTSTAEQTTRFRGKTEIQAIEFRQDMLGNYLEHPKFREIFRDLMIKGHLPRWVDCPQQIDINRLLFDVFTLTPQALPSLLSGCQNHHAAMFRIFQLVPAQWLIDAMRKAAPEHSSTIHVLERFQQCLQRTTIKGLLKQQQSDSFFQLLLRLWITNDWAAMAPDKLLKRYFYELMQQRFISKETLRSAFFDVKHQLPEALQVAITQTLEAKHADKTVMDSHYPDKNSKQTPALKRGDLATDDETLEKQQKNKLSQLEKLIQEVSQPHPLTSPMTINNAGLVILQSFINPLFTRLKLIEDKQFISDNAQRRAVHYLQYLVTGKKETPEQYLMLNKLLCGLEMHAPVELSIDMSQQDEETCNSLLRSVIDYWSAIGQSSLDGFRGNWLVRSGSLSDAQDRWDVIVDKRAYDLLLERAPLSYSVIKLPWMKKAIYVTWPT